MTEHVELLNEWYGSDNRVEPAHRKDWALDLIAEEIEYAFKSKSQ